MVDKELIERYRKTVKPVVASWLLNINYEEMGEQDKEEFERDFDEILDLALIGLKHKAQLSQEGTTKDATSDTISRQAAIDALKRKTFRLTFAEEQNCEGHVAWSADAVYSDVMEGELLELPSAQPERKTGHWILYDKRFPWMRDYKCSECGNYLDFSGVNAGRGDANYCPNCGAKMEGETV